MKKLFVAACCIAIAVSLPRQAHAQKDKVKAKTTISAADKKEIIEIFKGVDSKKYRLQFNDGKETYGSQKIAMKDLQQASKVRNPMDENGYVVLVSADHGVVFVLAVTGSKLTDVLGAEKAARLNAVMAKYSR